MISRLKPGKARDTKGRDIYEQWAMMSEILFDTVYKKKKTSNRGFRFSLIQFEDLFLVLHFLFFLRVCVCVCVGLSLH